MWITDEANKESGGIYRWDSAQLAIKKVIKKEKIVEEVKDNQDSDYELEEGELPNHTMEENCETSKKQIKQKNQISDILK